MVQRDGKATGGGQGNAFKPGISFCSLIYLGSETIPIIPNRTLPHKTYSEQEGEFSLLHTKR